MLEWRSLVSLKASAIVAFVVLWNAGCLVGIHLSGGFGRPINREAAIAMAVTCAAASVFALAIALSVGLQSMLIAKSRRHDFRRIDFLIVAFIAGLLAFMTLMMIFNR